MRTRGWGPWRQNWYSLCSRHSGDYKPDCELCQAGLWHTAWIVQVDAMIYRLAYPVWHIWHNRRNSRINRLLRQHFPNMR